MADSVVGWENDGRPASIQIKYWHGGVHCIVGVLPWLALSSAHIMQQQGDNIATF